MITLLELILKTNIKDIEIEGIKKFDSIAEYNFSIVELVVLYEDNKKEKIYLKLIRGGKIKETIFCYWSLLYEEYSENNRKEQDDMIKKAIITQISSSKNSTSLLVTLNATLNYYAEVELIELKKFLKENIYNEGWVDDLEIEDDDILFIGRKLY